MHEVGAYSASFVPSVADFDRLDSRFQVSAGLWPEAVSADYGFAVFQIRRGFSRQIHPMAFRFQTRQPDTLFFPTLHIHDGTRPDVADFDHALYYQHPHPAGADDFWQPPDQQTAPDYPDTLSWQNAEVTVDLDRTAGLLHRGPIYRRLLRGILPNTDTRITLAPG